MDREMWAKLTEQSPWQQYVVRGKLFYLNGTKCLPFDFDEIHRTAFAVDSVVVTEEARRQIMTLGLAFWILMLIWAVFGVLTHFGIFTGSYVIGTGTILLFTLFGLLGWQTFGAPLHK